MVSEILKAKIEDWFLNSPSWPFEIEPEKEADDFMSDGTEYTREEVYDAISQFAASAR